MTTKPIKVNPGINLTLSVSFFSLSFATVNFLFHSRNDLEKIGYSIILVLFVSLSSFFFGKYTALKHVEKQLDS
jgi:hypothetical protein